MSINQMFQSLSFFLVVHQSPLYGKRPLVEFFRSMGQSNMDFLLILLRVEEFFLGDLKLLKWSNKTEKLNF